ncbi:hypothetical protein MP638_004688 [Amoeboaphelidium occidentale]|nr:hypothetical protein MP638_004688 [Amoeboaphelidium occidentale]
MSDQRFIPPDTSQDHSESNPHVDQAFPMDLDDTDKPTDIVDIEMEPLQRIATSAVDVITFGADVDGVPAYGSKRKKRSQANKQKSTLATNIAVAMTSVDLSASYQTVTDETAGTKCSSCSGLDHQRKSSKKCPYYQGKMADRYKENDYEESECTIKLSLNQLLAKSLSDNSKQSLKDAIEDAVNCASDIYVDATRFLHGFIIWLMERNHPVPDLRHSEGIMAKIFQVVKFKSARDPYNHNRVNYESINKYADEIFHSTRNGLAYGDGSGISYTVNILARNYKTNCMKYIQMNIYKWLKQHVRYKLHKHVGSFVSAKSLTTLEKYLMHQLSRKSFQNNMVAFPMEALRIVGEPGNDTEKVTTSDILERVVRIWDKTLALLNFRRIDKDSVQADWWKYVPSVWKLLKCSSKNYESEALRRKEQNIKGRSLRLFNIVPQASHHPSHAIIDSCVLHQLTVSAGIAGEFGCAKQDSFLSDAAKFWAMCFDVKRLTTMNKRFSLMISTNGVEVGVLMKKRVALDSLDDWGHDKIGLDPGRRNLFDAVAGADNDLEKLSCSNGRWREISGAHHCIQKRRHWMSQNKDLMNKLKESPTFKRSSTEELTEYRRHFFSIRDAVFGFFRRPKWRRLKFKTRIARQKAYDKLAKELTNGDPNTTIAYGGGKFYCSSKELKRRCRVRLVSEYRTSQVCHNCHSQLEEVYGAIMVPDKHGRLGKNGKVKLKMTGRRKLCWGLKKCTNRSANFNERSFCLTLWDRDVNAALNIRQVFLYRNAYNNKAPIEFKREKKEDEEVPVADNKDSTTPNAMDMDT